MKKRLRSKRFTVVCERATQSRLIDKFLELGAAGYTVVECQGRGKS